MKLRPSSPGPMVDVERRWHVPGRRERRGDFDRLTPEQAIELGKRLIEAGEGR